MNMDTILCATCGAEIPADSTTCPECNQPVEQVDNADSIEAMIRSAQMIMEDSEVVFDDPDDEDLAFPDDVNSIDNPETNIAPKELTNEQMKKLDNGELVELSAMPASFKKTESLSKPSLDEPVDILDEPVDILDEPVDILDEPINILDEPVDIIDEPPVGFVPTVDPTVTQEEQKPADEPKNKKASKEKKPKKVKASSKKSKEKAPKAKGEKKEKGGFSVKTLVVCVAIVAVFGTAFVLLGQLLGKYTPSAQQKYAQSAVCAIAQSVCAGKDFTVLEAYINEKSESTVCLIYGAASSSTGQAELSWYRVTSDKSEPDKLNIYLPLSNDYYELLKNNGTEEDYVLASVLKSYDNEMQREIAEVSARNDMWTVLDAAEVNYYAKEKIKKDNPPVVTQDEETETTELSDIEDLE